ncbi:MAG: sigma factor [Archangium sp.]|nr:sigma factor [Archangium sp.]MDP3575090.1 sigma factor [Archangium sp.]
MDRDTLYREVTETHGASLGRLAAGYEAEPDLLQDIHASVWRSLGLFDRRCSLRTWVYRVAHNVATSHLIKQAGVRFVELEDVVADFDVEAVEACESVLASQGRRRGTRSPEDSCPRREPARSSPGLDHQSLTLAGALGKKRP